MGIFSDCLIMAGGSGTRLWPASRYVKPKQFLPVSLSRTDTFFTISLKRALHVITETDGRVIVIAGRSHLPFLIEDCSKLSTAEKERIVLIPEPEAKNTAPAIACAIAYSQKTKGKNRTMLVLTCDHIIEPIDVFMKDVALAEPFAVNNNLVLFGISPSRPETGYGYIETPGTPEGGVYRVSVFHEKPDQKTAEEFFLGKRHLWNSGMFSFCCDYMMSEFNRLAVDVNGPFEQLKPPIEGSYKEIEGLRILDAWEGLDRAYSMTKSISFDKAISEKCSQITVVRANFNWTDIGSWDEYVCLLSGGSIGNDGSEVYFSGDRDNCFVDSDIPVALAGVEDLIVVIRSGKDGMPPTALIVKKGESQRVRDIVEQIKKAGKTEIL